MSCSSPRAECAANFRNPLQQLKAAMSHSAGEGRTSVPMCCSQRPSCHQHQHPTGLRKAPGKEGPREWSPGSSKS